MPTDMTTSSADFDAVDLDRLRSRRTVKWSLYGPDVLAAWVAEMDFDVAPPVRAAVQQAVDREDFGYTVADLGELTEACAEHVSRNHGWEVAPSRIFPVADVLSGLAAALDLTMPAGCRVVVPTPSYPPLFEIVELGGREVVEVPLVVGAAGPQLDLDAIDEALRDGAAGVLLCSPNNPTGRVFSADELRGLAAVVQSHSARVVVDEVHAPLVLPGAEHMPYASVCEEAADHATTVVSASKAWNLAGLRCAQVVTTSHADAARWRRLRVFEVAGPTPLGVAASVAAYRSGDTWRRELLDYLDRSRALLRELLAEELPEVTHHAPEGTYLAWLDCSALSLDDPAAHFLQRAGVALSDGPPFGAGNEAFVRLNFATSHALLERIVRQLGASTR